MGQTKSLVLLAGAALSLCASGALAQQASSDEIRATVAEMLSDAETRSSLLSSGDAGHDGRFFIAGDGFRLNVGGQLQVRYIADFRDDQNNDDFINGFQLRRIKLNFQGDINKDWFFRVRASADSGGVVENELDTGGNPTGRFTSANTGGFSPDYAYAGYKFANGVRVTAGQFKLPLLREELVGDERQLAAERSVTNYVFTQDYSQGVMFDYETETWRGAVAFSDGLATRNTDYTNDQLSSWFVSGGGLGESDFAVTARFEYLFSGGWKMFDDFTAAKGQDFGAMAGVAGHYQSSANSNITTDVDVQTLQYTADVTLEGDSWNIYGAFIGRHQDQRTGGADTDFADFGAVVQGGWRFAENTELFARWDAIFGDEDRAAFATEDQFNFVTFGLNHYWAGHAAKGTLDVVWSLDSTSGPLGGILPNTAVGLAGDTEENEIAFRAQFQLLF